MRTRFTVVRLPISATEKFSEAVYFFNQMVRSVNNIKTFPFHFSAFLSALRSTTFYLQTQFSDDEGFTDWYAEAQVDMKSDAALKRLNDLRVEDVHRNRVNLVVNSGPTLHESPIVVNSEIEFTSTTERDGKIVWRYSVDGKEYDSEPITEWEFESDGQSVLELCQAGLQRIELILKGWHAFHDVNGKRI